ncbi:AAA family ATPase [Pseudomonas sediminis]|uniref:AAA family ATPase n=1 Tax=Pseudomonas sediminis TaxID=1691904 RepID=A0ABX6SGS1_9PSED|nr:AAA family ATPase [Pseudomonas sediminis]QNG99909.1 AAA family ATPase [Pseudomonas sediminis]
MTLSYIEKLHLKDFRQFKILNVEFNKKFNFIAGPNGCGKTSILAGISHCLHHGAFHYSRFQEKSEFWTDLTVSGRKKRVGTGQNSIDIKGYRQQSIKAWNIPTPEKGRESVLLHEVNNKLDGFCPLFIGAERSIKYKQINGMTREQGFEQQLAQYSSSGTKSLYGEKPSNIKQWLVNRYFMIDKEWATEEKENWNRLIEHLPNLAPFNSDFSYVRTGKELEPIFSIYGEECYLEELSAGFQAVLSVVANIFEWIEGTRSEGGRLAANATGSVLIDELDLHLHPEWQFTLRDGLESLFPNIQFIVTTHSPHLLSSAKEGEIIIMERGRGQNEYSLKPTSKRFSGWSTDQILSEVMGVVSLENKDHELLIAEAFDKVEEGSIEGLRNAIDKLSKVAHPSDSILTVLNARYASMVALSND